jgi:hypothetical protein
MTPGVKVLLIVGSVRSGSTLVGNILGELDGFFHAGEVYNVWKNLVRARECGCGRPLPDCHFWSEVRDGRFGPLPNAVEVTRWQEETLRIRHLRHVLNEDGVPAPDRKALDAYRDALSRLYLAVGRATGANVIVDSSKWPRHAAMAASLEGAEPYFIHLVRDPRGVAYSRQMFTMGGNPGTRLRIKSFQVALAGWSWMKVNLATETVCNKAARGRFLRLRYEDFVARPRETLERALTLVGEPSLDLPLLGERTVRLNVNHTVGGNASRFRAGPVEIKEDVRWREAFDWRDRLVASTITLPLLRRYGYR